VTHLASAVDKASLKAQESLILT